MLNPSRDTRLRLAAIKWPWADRRTDGWMSDTERGRWGVKGVKEARESWSAIKGNQNEAVGGGGA